MTARALVVQHTVTEEPGRLGEWLPTAGVELEIVRPYAGEPLPSPLEADALIVLGGPMAATDDETAPWLPGTRELLRAAVTEGLPALGVCLGAQLLAAACGGLVQRAAAGPEFGVRELRLRPAAREDPLLTGLPPVVGVVQWHYDEVVALPAGADWLAESAGYPHQAFRVGGRAWGLQFHLEAALSTVAGWARNDAAELRAAGLEPAAVLDRLHAAEPELTATWRGVAQRFAGIVTGRGRGSPDPGRR